MHQNNRKNYYKQSNYFLDTGNQVDTSQSFHVINKQPSSSLLKFPEVVDIRMQKLDLCVLNEMVIDLSLLQCHKILFNSLFPLNKSLCLFIQTVFQISNLILINSASLISFYLLIAFTLYVITCFQTFGLLIQSMHHLCIYMNIS